MGEVHHSGQWQKKDYLNVNVHSIVTYIIFGFKNHFAIKDKRLNSYLLQGIKTLLRVKS